MKHKSPFRIYVRKAIWLKDAPQILDIEEDSFETPWMKDDFKLCLQTDNVHALAAEESQCLIGYCVYELHKKRIHLLNFAVSPQYRRYGVGTELVKKLVGMLRWQRRLRIVLEVRERNVPAQLFFRDSLKPGFRCTQILHGHFVDTDEDAYEMQYFAKSPNVPINRLLNY